MNRSYDIAVEQVSVPSDTATVEKGEQVATTHGCTGCHGADLEGSVLSNDAAFGFLVANRLAPGSSGVGSLYTESDWVRSIRHGMAPDGKPLLFMPSHEYCYPSDDDLGALLAYVTSVPAVDSEFANDSPGPLARILFVGGLE